jgi:hypothetical protein
MGEDGPGKETGVKISVSGGKIRIGMEGSNDHVE